MEKEYIESKEPLVSRDGGPLFWKYFEDKVIEHIIKEHELIRLYKNQLMSCVQAYYRQKHILFET
jgi:hypothetical protein